MLGVYYALFKELLKLSSNGNSTIYSAGGMLFPKPLTSEEENYYVEKYAEGDESAKDILVERNLRLVAHIAKKYISPNASGDDLISIGTIGLIKAVGSFKADKGIKLGTYAVRCIENEILMFMRSGKKYQNEVSLHDPVGTDKEGNEILLEDILSLDDTEMLDEIDASFKSELLSRCVKRYLTSKERQIIVLRYGLSNGRELTQREVGRLLGISRSYVSRIEKKALEKLGKVMV